MLLFHRCSYLVGGMSKDPTVICSFLDDDVKRFHMNMLADRMWVMMIRPREETRRWIITPNSRDINLGRSIEQMRYQTRERWD